MNSVLRELVELGGGLVTLGTAGQVVPSWTLQQACRNGELVRVLPEVFVAAHLVGGRPGVPVLSRLDPALSQRAALAWTGGYGALSHLSALAVWGLRPEAVGDLVHLSAPASASLRTRPGVIVHRRRGLTIETPQVTVRRGLMVTRLEQALVDSWPTVPPADRQALVIRAVNDWLTTPERLSAALERAPKLIDRAALRHLLTKLADG
ncbi:hypothetical protein [Micromonospora sp. NBC_00860]|uniref:hypothetical protein n=1 Tax=Micromonospora sp. NBC_00860 TaxID=2975980 RepID=UPI003870745D|nr:hypothetical protein OH804_10435 [Micromonospora sp. NBC_00860]